MKKLLILMLVLGLVSTASAVTMSLTSGGSSTLTIGTDVEIDDVITVDLVLADNSSGLQYVDFVSSTSDGTKPLISAVGSWAQMTIMPDAGTLTSGDILDATASAPGGQEKSGTVYSFSATVKGTGEITPVMTSGDYWFVLTNPYFYYGNTVTQNALTIVPEPATVMLLGLGGLLLRRRKK